MSAPESTEHDDIIMNFSEMYLEMQLIDRRPTVDEAFGKNCTLCPQSRDPQMIDIVKAINETNKTSTQSKRGSFFIHASPGVGKTFLLSQLYRYMPYCRIFIIGCVIYER
jgi:flagellar biosynthesis/type III secretory pathway ATPase